MLAGMRPRTKQWLSDSTLLGFMLACIAAIHAVRLLGVEVPYLERSAPARLHRHPEVSAGVAAFLAAAIVALWFAPAERRPLRLAIGTALLLAGLASAFFFDPVLGMSFALASGPLLRREPGAGAPGAFAPGPRNPRVSLWTLLLPLLAALLATGVTSKLRSGAIIPAPGAEAQLRESGRYLSASPVLVVPASRPGGFRLAPAPLDRQQLVQRIRGEGRGWTVANMLEVLDRLELLERLPPTDLQRVEVLVGPMLGSGLPGTAKDGAPAGRPHWGVVVEAQRDSGEPLLFLSLGEGEPSSRPAPYHHLLFVLRPGGASPILLRAEAFAPSASGFEGIALPGVFILYLLGFLVVSVLATLFWSARRGAPPQRMEGAP
jgi:hypothetical protein